MQNYEYSVKDIAGLFLRELLGRAYLEWFGRDCGCGGWLRRLRVDVWD